jgi:hypothetical protein
MTQRGGGKVRSGPVASRPWRPPTTPNCRIPPPLIPDIAAYPETWRAQIPTINGSNPVNEHFFGSFRQHDTVFRLTIRDRPAKNSLDTERPFDRTRLPADAERPTARKGADA